MTIVVLVFVAAWGGYCYGKVIGAKVMLKEMIKEIDRINKC